MPMISIETVKKADALISERRRIASAKWNAIVDDPNLRPKTTQWVPGRLQVGQSETADEELQWAIEEFRKRKLEAIDAQLRELGIDPTIET